MAALGFCVLSSRYSVGNWKRENEYPLEHEEDASKTRFF